MDIRRIFTRRSYIDNSCYYITINVNKPLINIIDSNGEGMFTMENIQLDILRVLYDNNNTIMANDGWHRKTILEKVSQYSNADLVRAFIGLLAGNCIELVIPRPLAPAYIPYAASAAPTPRSLVAAAIGMPKSIPVINLEEQPARNYKITNLGVKTYVLQRGASISNDRMTIPKTKDIFLIHGHNEAKWRELKAILKDEFKLNPIELSEQANVGCTTIIDKFEHYAKNCSFAFAIFTPDDLVEKDGKNYLQARPNVVFELGWFVSRLGRKHASILYQDNDKMSILSDLDGVMQLRFKDNIKELYLDIRTELAAVDIIEKN